MQWAGCFLLDALGQHKIFNAFEFNNHILSALQQDPIYPGVYDALRNPTLDIAEMFALPKPGKKEAANAPAVTVPKKLAEFFKLTRFIHLVNQGIFDTLSLQK